MVEAATIVASKRIFDRHMHMEGMEAYGPYACDSFILALCSATDIVLRMGLSLCCTVLRRCLIANQARSTGSCETTVSTSNQLLLWK